MKKEKYQEQANQIVEYVKANFGGMKIEEDEEAKLIIASNIASVTLSEKRAYFNGRYTGADANKRNGEIINLDSIKSIRLKRRMDTKQKTIISIATLLIAVAICICLGTFSNAVNARDIEYEQIYLILISGTIALILFVFVCVYWSLGKYQMLQFVCKGHKYGIEIRNRNIYDEAQKIILVAKQKEQPIQQIQNIYSNQDDKVTRLSNLSNLYEQGLINQEEFKQLKQEIISDEAWRTNQNGK